MPANVILIKHAMPLVDPAVPAPDWPLSDAGKADALRLANLLRRDAPCCIVPSPQPKAQETGAILAAALAVPLQPAHPGLAEQDNSGEPFQPDPATFRAQVERYLAQPQAVVYGRESASMVAERMQHALDALLAPLPPDASIVLVSHGRSITALLQSHDPALDAFGLWRALGLPSFVRLRRPDLRLVAVVPNLPN